MWITVKAQDGDTLDLIAKRYKNKDSNAILQYAGNKKIAACLKKGETLARGVSVCVLDPKGKVYIVKGPKGEVVLNEKEYKAFQKDVHAQMDKLLERQRINYNYAVNRHDAQLAVNKDQWFVSSVVGTFNSVDEPKNGWKVAKAAYKKLESTVKARDYKAFEKAAVACEEEVTRYTNDVHNWINGLIDTAEGTVTVLKGVKEVGKFCGVLAAVTIAAPATLAAGVAVGAASSAGVGLLYDGGENIGLAANGMKTMSAQQIAKNFLVNAATGAASAFIAGNLLKLVKGPLVSALTNNTFVKTQAARVAGKVIPKYVYEAELKIVIGQVNKGGTVYIDKYLTLIAKDRVMIEAATKFFVRGGNGLMMKAIGSGKIIEDALFSWVKTGPSELGGKDEKSVGSAAASHLMKSGVADTIFDKVITDNLKEFRKVLNEVLAEQVKKADKKAA